jgi:hypothetical protein
MGYDESHMRVWNPHQDFGGLDERQIKEATFLLWRGWCSVHQRFSPEHVGEFRAAYPNGEVIVHPECKHEVVELADRVGSTERILEWATEAPAGAVIGVGTEIHMIQRMAEEMPDKTIVSLDPLVCLFHDVPHRQPHFAVESLSRAGREPDRGRRCTASGRSSLERDTFDHVNSSPRTFVSVVITTFAPASAEQLATFGRVARSTIVVGDGAPTDGTRIVLVECCRTSRTPRPGLPLRDEQVGFRINVELTAQRATGDIVCFADHDDVWRHDKVERMVAALQGRSRAAAFSNGRIIDAAGTVGRSDLWARAGFARSDQRAVRDGDGLRVLLAKRVVTGAALACSRDLLEQALPFPDAAVHDYWIALNAAATGDLVALSEPLIDYRLHGSGDRPAPRNRSRAAPSSRRGRR